MLNQEDFFNQVLGKIPRESGVTKNELYTVYSSVLATSHLDGSIAELGVFRGATAKLISEFKGNRKLLLFDTFKGMPNELIDPKKDNWEKNTHTETSLEVVKDRLKSYDNIEFFQGIFPKSTSNINPKEKFSFIHLDADLYKSTLEALKFFWPRLEVGGRIVSHNYKVSDVAGGNTPGVKLAFKEYFKDKNVEIKEVAETQCLVIKKEIN